ncbi:MAG TPA: homogentisate 1,2-dioxygenase [Chloroflexota bacterium]
MYRKGNVPRRGEETELFAHSYTRKGFFGPYATLYKTRNPGEPTRRDRALSPLAIDLNETRPSDMDRADGRPMRLFANDELTVHVSRRREAMPYCWRNADGDELYFIHQGPARFETELGALEAVIGDFVYLPRNVVYRVIPRTEDALHLILETQTWLEPADRYHRDHGETTSGLDLSLIEVPEPEDNEGPPRSEYEVRVKIEDQIYSSTFDYDPVGVTVGWSGDPVVFKLNVWDVPSASLPSTPPTAAVFIADGMGCVVTAHSPLMQAGGRRGGPPAHTNDYDELWFLHTAGSSRERAGQVGKLRWEPQGDTQPGFRRPSGDAPRGAPDHSAPHMQVNIDVRHRLHVCQEAEAYAEELRRPAAARA